MRGVAATVLLIVLGSQALAQEPRPGVGADARSGQVDPTRNVLDLVQAAIQRQDDLRNAEAKFQNAMRDAEARRANDLAAQKQLFDLELARALKAKADSSTLLLSTVLKELKTDSNERVTKLEQRAYETIGRGAGIGDVFGWVMAVIMALVTLAAVFWRRNADATK